MTFKTQMAADMAHMMDTDVFAELRVIDGVSADSILHEIEFKDLGPAFEGGLGQAAKLWARTADIGSYVPDQVVMIDGVSWTVADAVDEDGMQVLSLYRNRS